jgi:dinuclear metal center YbgI/SA1388 family protein
VSSTIPGLVGDVAGLLDERYPASWADEWDRVGLVVGDPTSPVHRVLFVVDCLPQTLAEAVALGADMIVAHHPLLLRGVSSVATTTYKGRVVHGLIKNDIALYVAHTNADHACPGVSDALASRLGLVDLRPLRPLRRPGIDEPGLGSGRIGRLPTPVTLGALAAFAADVLPATVAGVRAAGDPGRIVTSVAVCGGAGDTYLGDAAEAGVDAYLTADLRHHPVSEHLANRGPALLDAAHWATERPWLDDVAGFVGGATGVETIVSDLDTDPWTVHASGGAFMGGSTGVSGAGAVSGAGVEAGSVGGDMKEPRE